MSPINDLEVLELAASSGEELLEAGEGRKTRAACSSSSRNGAIVIAGVVSLVLGLVSVVVMCASSSVVENRVPYSMLDFLGSSDFTQAVHKHYADINSMQKKPLNSLAHRMLVDSHWNDLLLYLDKYAGEEGKALRELSMSKAECAASVKFVENLNDPDALMLGQKVHKMVVESHGNAKNLEDRIDKFASTHMGELRQLRERLVPAPLRQPDEVFDAGSVRPVLVMSENNQGKLATRKLFHVNKKTMENRLIEVMAIASAMLDQAANIDDTVGKLEKSISGHDGIPPLVEEILDGANYLFKDATCLVEKEMGVDRKKLEKELAGNVARCSMAYSEQAAHIFTGFQNHPKKDKNKNDKVAPWWPMGKGEEKLHG